MAYYGFKPAEQAIQIGDNTIVSADIADGSIVNADLNSSAAIAMSKTQLAAGTGITLATNTLNVDAAQTQITSVGTLSSLTLGGDLLVPQYIKHVGDTDCHIEFGTDEIKLRTGDSSRLIARDANVEIYPPLVATSATFAGNITLSGSSTTRYLFLNSGGNGGVWQEGNHELRFGTNDTERMKIAGNGNATFNHAVHFSNTIGTTGVSFNSTGQNFIFNSEYAMYFNTDSTGGTAERFVFGSGRTGITGGTEWLKITNSQALFTLTGGGGAVAVFKDATANANVLIQTTVANKNSILNFGDADATEIGQIDYDHNDNSMKFVTDGTTALTLDSSQNATFAGKIDAPGQWELIAIDKLSSDGMIIQNNTCFSSDNYIMFKLVIGWIGFNGGDDLYFRWIENGSETTASDYFGGTDIATHGSTTREHKAFASLDNVPIFEDPWNDLSGGVHGEIQIYNATAPTVDGLNTDRGQKYRPWFHANLFGYDASGGDAGYGMQETWARFNSNMNPENIDGYKIYTVNNNLEAKSHIFVYGLRTA